MSGLTEDSDVSDVELLNSLASVHMMFGLYETAQSVLELSDWIDRSNPRTLRLLARSHAKQGNSEMALKTINRLHVLVGSDDMQKDDLTLKARALLQLGQKDEARELMMTGTQD